MKTENIEILKNGGVGVIPTDTIYGLVGSALKPETVERISRIKNRSDGKGFIVLISSIEYLKVFGVELTDNSRIFLDKYWPGKVSVIFAVPKKFEYLGKGLGLAVRLPDREDLREMLKQTGPLVAPSANPEGLPPAKNIEDAKKYFDPSMGRAGNQVDFYEDGGDLESLPSTLVRISGDHVEILRQGAVSII